MAILSKVNDELARLAKEETDLDRSYMARKRAINARQLLLTVALTKITPELEALVEQLGVNLT